MNKEKMWELISEKRLVLNWFLERMNDVRVNPIIWTSERSKKIRQSKKKNSKVRY